MRNVGRSPKAGIATVCGRQLPRALWNAVCMSRRESMCPASRIHVASSHANACWISVRLDVDAQGNIDATAGCVELSHHHAVITEMKVRCVRSRNIDAACPLKKATPKQ